MSEASRERSSTPDVHPGLLQDVTLTLRPTAGEPSSVRTKVLDVEPHADGSALLAVTCPDGFDPREHHFDATVSWTYPLGRMECPVTTRPGSRAYGNVWLLTPTAAPTRLQQRAYFRARIAVPVVLDWQEPDEERLSPSLTGVVVDLSEGGLLAMFRLRPPAVGTPGEVTIHVDGSNLTQPARVVRHVGFAGGTHGAGVAFADPTVHGDVIRRLVFATQRRRVR